MSIHMHEKAFLVSALSLGLIEGIDKMSFDILVKVSLQSTVGLLTIVYLIFKILNEKNKYQNEKRNRMDSK